MAGIGRRSKAPKKPKGVSGQSYARGIGVRKRVTSGKGRKVGIKRRALKSRL